jgi:hypothetical protein
VGFAGEIASRQYRVMPQRGVIDVTAFPIHQIARGGTKQTSHRSHCMVQVSALPKQRGNQFVRAQYRRFVEMAEKVPAPSLDRLTVVGRHDHLNAPDDTLTI